MAWQATMAVALLTALLAGCVGGEEATDELILKNRAIVTATAGGIQGVLTDAAVQPIAGATITLEGTGSSTRTASDGSYAFSSIPPAVYLLRYEAEGFIPTQQETVVRSGEVTRLDVILAHLPSTIPFIQQREFAGFVECSVATPVVLVSVCSVPNSVMEDVGLGGNFTSDRFIFPFIIESNPWQVVAELSWDPNSALGDQMRLLVEQTEHFNDRRMTFAVDQGPSPLVVTAGREQIRGVDTNMTAVCNGEEEPAGTRSVDQYCKPAYAEEGGDAWVRLFVWFAEGLPTGFTFQQRYDLIVTTFHHAPACPDYSVLLDNRCEQPLIPAIDDDVEDGADENETGP